MQTRYRALTLVGLPGSGKGTVGRVLGKVPGIFYFSTGDMFRALPPESEAAREAQPYLARGELAPDELTIRVWSDCVRQEAAAGRFVPERDVLLLDGLPRTRPQAELLETHVDMLQVLHLAVHDDEQVLQRMRKRAVEEHRSDDREEVMRRRLEVYREQTQQLFGHYPADRIAEINALQTPLAVLADVIAALLPLQGRFRG